MRSAGFGGGSVNVDHPQDDNKIDYNRIYNCKLVLQDGGGGEMGLYIDGACGDSTFIIKHNVQENVDVWDWRDNCMTSINNRTLDQSVKDSSGLQACYRAIINEPIAPLPGDVAACTPVPPVALSQPRFSLNTSVKPFVTKVRMYNLQGRLIATSDRMPGALHGGIRPMNAGIVIVKKEFAAGSGGRSVLAVVK